VLAKFYTGKDLLRLKRIYDKAGLRVLSQRLFLFIFEAIFNNNKPPI